MDENQLAILASLLQQRQVPVGPANGMTLVDLLRRVQQQGMQPQQQGMPENPLRIEGGGGVGGGILSGGGRASYEMPNTLGGLLQLYAGGGGAVGSVNTPQGQQRIREFQPEFGFQYRLGF